jgi:hypothetical protein
MTFLRRHLRILILAGSLAGLFFLIGFFEKYHLPRIKQWLLVEIESYSHQNSPVRVWPQSVDFGWLPLGVRLHDVKILPQKGLETTLAPTKITELDVSLNLWALARGQLRIGEIKISGADLNLIIRAKKDSPGTSSGPLNLPNAPSDLTFETLAQIPITALTLENVKFAIKAEEQGLALQSDQIELKLENRFRSIRGDVQARNLKFKKTGNNPVFETDLNTNFMFDNDGLYFSSIRLQKGESFFDGTGSVRGHLLKNQIKDVRARLRTHENMAEVSSLVRDWFRIQNFPAMSGDLEGDTEFDFTPPKNIQAKFHLKTKDYKIDRYSVGHIDATGQLDENKLRLARAHFSYFYGDVSVENGEYDFNEHGDFKADLKTKDLDLNGLLRAIGLKGTPVYTQLSGQLPCHGEALKSFSLTCEGALSTPNLKVVRRHDGKDDGTIVDLDQIQVAGSVTVDTKSVSYQSRLQVGSSQGTSTA